MEIQKSENILKRFSGWQGLLFLMVLCQGVGIAGAFVTADSVGGWYVDIVKPSFNPPSWVFGPVWTALYFMMALACWFMIRTSGAFQKKKLALSFFILQLIANGIWSFLFFGLKNPGLALMDIIILWVLIGLAILSFLRVSKFAASLMVPYWAWVSFATLLNFSIWRLN